jgi:hypothetical protein
MADEIAFHHRVRGDDLLERLRDLHSMLDEAGKISVDDIANQVRRSGFECIKCGCCCIGEDNCVLVFPDEIRRIISVTGESWLEVAEPPKIGEWDSDGNFHTLEWRLKKKDGNCRYFVDGKCIIYEVRPAICKTYPFYLDNGTIKCSLCRGLGRRISAQASQSLACDILERYITEIEEAIKLTSRYRDFMRGKPSNKGICIVHDSFGEHRIDWKDLPGHLMECASRLSLRSELDQHLT